MKRIHLSLLSLLLMTGCLGEPVPDQEKGSLVEARRGFKTKLVSQNAQREAVPEPPPEIFRKVIYDSPAGKLAAYLSKVPDDGKKRPAIVWITGGDCNSIGDLWSEAPPDNDQTASAYRKAGIVLMFPSLRGGNTNPGIKEGFLGEVDDVLAAADFLARQDSVDPGRIYLGGHSTGGTLVLLVAEATDRFRAVFSFGPASDVSYYPSEFIPFDTSNRREVELRSPGRWLSSIHGPTFVFEGTEQGNLSSLQAMAKATKNPTVHFLPVKGATHFSILAPTNALIARKILADTAPKSNLAFTEQELNQLFVR
jgi:dipeptidyl aminopeptidase/acylaminoacyl peptidase